MSSANRARRTSKGGSFDILIVGAGPAAAATLMGLKDPGQICVVTGVSTTTAPSTHVHPKIRTVADRRREPAGITDPITVGETRTLAFSTATVGGLANYWGQQFIRYLPTDPWPHGLFGQYEQYVAACARIEAAFSIDQVTTRSQTESRRIAPYCAEHPRLLVGSADDPAAGLLSMRRTIEKLIARHNATAVATRVKSLAYDGANWRVQLIDGSIVSARRIILAAGVLGTAGLLMRSFPEVSSVRLRDHAPWMLYTRGLEQLVTTTRSDKEPNFNVQTISRDLDSGPALFATIYNMRYAELNLIFANLTGWSFPTLAGLRAPWPADIIKPIQVWTNNTVSTVDIERDDNKTQVITYPTISADRELARFVGMLRDNNVSILKISTTLPLQGFHYFGLEVSIENGALLPVEEFLAERSRFEVSCCDASGIREIGCRPPMETMMARTLALASFPLH
jgi:hypothetical protein